MTGVLILVPPERSGRRVPCRGAYVFYRIFVYATRPTSYGFNAIEYFTMKTGNLTALALSRHMGAESVGYMIKRIRAAVAEGASDECVSRLDRVLRELEALYPQRSAEPAYGRWVLTG